MQKQALLSLTVVASVVVLCGSTVAATAQTPQDAWLQILEPVEWRDEVTRGIEVRQRRSLRVEGLAYHPGGIAEILLNGARSALVPQSDGSIRFRGFVAVDSGVTEVELRVTAVSGPPLLRSYPVRSLPAAAAYDEPEQAWSMEGVLPERWAVVVGVGEYADPMIPRLRYADDDARAFHAFLTSPGAGLGGLDDDHVLLLVNEQATYRNIRTALFTFLKSATDQDIVYIYFAGHGTPDPERPEILYLLPFDAEASNIAGTGLPMDQVQDAIERTFARHMVVLTDACHSAGVGGTTGLRAGGINPINREFLNLLEASTSGIAVFTASEANQYSQEGPQWGGGHGVFTWALLRALEGIADEDGDRVVTLGEAIEWTRSRVRRETRNAQIPTISQTAFDRSFPMSVVVGDVAAEVQEPGVAAVGVDAVSPPLVVLPDAAGSDEAAAAPADGAEARAQLYSPAGSAARSLLVPGLGQYHTGRPVMGTLFLAGAAAGVAYGLLNTRTTVECLDAVEPGADCPDGRVRDTHSERPQLVTGLAIAGGAALLGAIDAYRGARRANARAATPGRRSEVRQGAVDGVAGTSLTLLPPTLSSNGGAAHLELLRLRF